MRFFFLFFSPFTALFAFPQLPETSLAFAEELREINSFLPKKQKMDIEAFHKNIKLQWFEKLVPTATEKSKAGSLLKGHLQKVLSEAAISGDTKTVEYLITKTGGLVDPSASSNGALKSAASAGNDEIVRILLTSEKTDPNSALNFAIHKGRANAFKLLLETGKIYKPTLQDGALTASIYGREEMLKTLINEYGVDPAMRNNKLIKLAAWNGRSSIAKFLLEYEKVDPTVSNNEAIKIAVDKEYWDTVWVLLGTGKVDPEVATYKNSITLNAAKSYAWISGFKKDPSVLRT